MADDFLNPETLVTAPVTMAHWETELRRLIQRHAQETGSVKALQILQDWEIERVNFVQICPKEMLVHLPVPLREQDKAIPAQ